MRWRRAPHCTAQLTYLFALPPPRGWHQAIRTCPIATARLAACLAGEGPPTSGTGAGAGSGAGGGAGVGAGAGGASAACGTAALRIPKELWRLVDFLFKR